MIELEDSIHFDTSLQLNKKKVYYIAAISGLLSAIATIMTSITNVSTVKSMQTSSSFWHLEKMIEAIAIVVVCIAIFIVIKKNRK